MRESWLFVSLHEVRQYFPVNVYIAIEHGLLTVDSLIKDGDFSDFP